MADAADNLDLGDVRISYREASRRLGKGREAIAEIAKSRGLEHDPGPPLDLRGLREIASILNVATADLVAP